MCEADGDRLLQNFELRPSTDGIYFSIDLGAAARYHHRQAERKQDARFKTQSAAFDSRGELPSQSVLALASKLASSKEHVIRDSLTICDAKYDSNEKNLTFPPR